MKIWPTHREVMSMYNIVKVFKIDQNIVCIVCLVSYIRGYFVGVMLTHLIVLTVKLFI